MDFTVYIRTLILIFVPEDTEEQGTYTQGSVTPAAGGDNLTALRDDADDFVAAMLAADPDGGIGHYQVPPLARAYGKSWSTYYEDTDVLDQVVAVLDYYAYFQGTDPSWDDYLHTMFGTRDADAWEGHGDLARSLMLVYDALDSRGDFSETVNFGDGNVTRRVGYADFFAVGRDWRVSSPNWPIHYTNQVLYCAVSYCAADKVAEMLDDSYAWSAGVRLTEAKEAVGLIKWDITNPINYGSYNWQAEIPNPVEDYHVMTSKGLSRELGYVSHYGEVGILLARLAQIMNDTDITNQAIKFVQARAPFYFHEDDRDGYRALHTEGAIGTRHDDHIGYATYHDETLEIAAVLQDDVSVRLGQLYINHNRVDSSMYYFQPWAIDWVRRAENYETVDDLAATEYRLPMESGEPNSVFADEEIGVVAAKIGDTRFYANMWYRTPTINDLARVHLTTPSMDRFGSVAMKSVFNASGTTMTRDSGYGYFENEVLHVSDGQMGGRAEFFELRYGPFLIGMNSSNDTSYTFDPVGFDSGYDMVSETTKYSPMSVAARTSVVFHSSEGWNNYSVLSYDDFETDLGSWSNVGGDDYSWTRDNNGTPSSNTGPDYDTSTARSDYYVFFETSDPVSSGDDAFLESSEYDADTYNMHLYFTYHMYGSSMGTLYVDVYDGSWNNDVWHKTGQQHGDENEAYAESGDIDLSAYSGTIKIRFRGVDGNDYMGDMAIGEVLVTGEGAPTVSAPTVTNSAATNITASAARLNGEVTSTGGEAPTVTIYWGDDDAGTTAVSWDNSEAKGTQSSTFYDDISSLDPDTTYYFRCYATNSAGNDWADSTAQFDTVAAPTVTNSAATDITGNSATLNGEVTDTGGEAPTVTIYWGDDDAGTTAVSWDYSIGKGTQSSTYSSGISSLDPETTYYFRSYATNSAGNDWADSTAQFDTTAASSVDYTELWQEISASSADSWVDADLSAYVPADAVVEIVVRNSNTNAQRWAGVRANGSSIDRRIQLHESESGGWDMMTMNVQVDGDSKIEVYADHTSSNKFYLAGYWSASTYVEKMESFSASSTGSWVDKDLTGYGVSANQVVELLVVNNSDASEYIGGVRANGSSDNRYIDIHEADAGGDEVITMLTTADGDGKIEVYAENASIDFRLVGYWTTAPGTYTEEFSSVGKPASDNSWLDLDLTAGGAPDGSICELLMCNGHTSYENYMGVRANGSSITRRPDVHDSEGGGRDGFSMHVKSDGSAVIEQLMEDRSDTGEFYLLGYWE